MSAPLLLSIDQGTTSSRAMLFEKNGDTFAVAQREFTQHYPDSGWVEHDPEEIWETTLAVCREALGKADEANRTVAGIGITNQRETTLVWERATGKPIHRAIVWQDRRTSERCRALRDAGHADAVTATTGLLLDPYFSGTKIGWILDHVSGARARARGGRARLRHRRHVPDPPPERRRRARDRHDQRVPHAPVRHPEERLGRGHVPPPRRADGDAARGA